MIKKKHLIIIISIIAVCFCIIVFTRVELKNQDCIKGITTESTVKVSYQDKLVDPKYETILDESQIQLLKEVLDETVYYRSPRQIIYGDGARYEILVSKENEESMLLQFGEQYAQLHDFSGNKEYDYFLKGDNKRLMNLLEVFLQDSRGERIVSYFDELSADGIEDITDDNTNQFFKD